MDCRTFREVVNRLYIEHEPSARSTEPWEEIVMTVLSQNTSDDNRDKAYEQLQEHYRTPGEILDADNDELEELIAPAGLQVAKAEYLKNAARHIVEEHGGDLDWIMKEPKEEVHDELTGIHGIGHKTADVILLFAADKEVCPVDTHVHRVANRLGAVEGSRKATRDQLMALHDECGVDLRKAHISLIAHGRETCNARKPLCSECVVEEYCEKVGVETQG